MKLTKRDKAHLLMAAELVDSGERSFTCFAIAQAVKGRHWEDWDYPLLVKKFMRFCDAYDMFRFGSPFREGRQQRIMALLFFREIGEC
jgi:hypothetical protein